MSNEHTKGEWKAFNMIHAERGDSMTAEEIGEYVKNNVLKSIEDGGSADRFLFISTGEEGAPDIALIGNGPAGPANAKLIAAAPDLLAVLLDLSDHLEVKKETTATDHALEGNAIRARMYAAITKATS